MTFKASVLSVRSAGKVCEIAFSASFGRVVMLGLEIPSGLKVGGEVKLGFKSADVMIAEGSNLNILTHNKIPAIIEKITEGEIISALTLSNNDFKFEALIPSELASNLKPQTAVTALVSETSLYVSEVL